MKRTACLCSIAFLISAVAFLGFVDLVKAYTTEVEDWSEPVGYAYAYVAGNWYKLGIPYYRVHHTARIFECLRGRCHFIGWNKYGSPIYSKYYLVTPVKTYSSPYNVVWTAQTECWAPYYNPPSPYMEYASAFLPPPGML